MTEIVRVPRQQREALNGHRGGLIYLTGLSGAGKSTLAALAERRLHQRGFRACVLDGDALRRGLCRDLGFSDADRVENMRRVAAVGKLMVDAGLLVITALISPFRADRDAARACFEPGDFVEVFVDAPLAVCEARDPKGLYKRARRGEIPDFTGIGSAYEPPLEPDLRIDSAALSCEEAADRLIAHLEESGFIRAAVPAFDEARRAGRLPARW